MSERLNRAVAFAVEAHRDQIRKIDKSPFILHPFEVAATAAQMTGDEDVLIAALLHDTVEDTETTIEDVRLAFGDRVAELVAHETENKRRDMPASASWKIRKEESLAVLRTTQDRDVKILWLSDKLANMRSLYRDYLKMGDAVFARFNEKNKGNHAWYYLSVLDCVNELAGEYAYEEYANLTGKIFGKGE